MGTAGLAPARFGQGGTLASAQFGGALRMSAMRAYGLGFNFISFTFSLVHPRSQVTVGSQQQLTQNSSWALRGRIRVPRPVQSPSRESTRAQCFTGELCTARTILH